MSCRPAVMPNTRMYIVRRLDSQEQEVILQKKATGGECLDKVCKSLGILERDYFGLRYVDKNGEYLWINLRNPLHEQLVPGNRPVMEMRVKYFVKPQKLLQPVTRYHFYKQLKRDLLHGKLKVGTSVKAARLTALIAQIEKGDYRVGFQYQHKVMCQADSDNMDARIRREHQKIAGTSVEMATEKFLEEVAMLELYGVELYHVLNNHRVPQVIGVGPENVQVYSRSMELQKRFSYSSVQYTAFHAKKFTALVASHSSNNETHRPVEQMDFELKSRAASQALYRTITEFHTFFRRESVSSVVKTAGFCKSLLGNFKGMNPDRFYFDVMKTHREVVDHVWSILHPSTTLLHDSDDAQSISSTSSSRRHHTSEGAPSPSRRSSSASTRSVNHTHSHHRDHSPALSNSGGGGGGGGSRRGSTQHVNRSPTPSSSDYDPSNPPPLPPPARHMQRASNMHRSRSVQEADIRHAIIQRNPPLPPYSQRSCSSDALMRASIGRRSARNMPNHGPHMASTATFNPYMSPSISETESDIDESLYASGGSDCYVAMSTQSEPAYYPSTRSDASGSSIASSSTAASNDRGGAPVHPTPGSDISGIQSDTYITSGDSECSNGSFRAHSPPPLYTEVDPENTVSISFSESMLPDSGSLSLVSPIIPVPAGTGTNSAVFNFDAAAVLTRTRELEGELQRLRSAMTCRLCKQNPIGATFCPCGHTVCCFQCAQRLRTCWECNEQVHSVQRMLLAR